MGVNAMTARGKGPRAELDATYRASRRFVLLITVKDLRDGFVWMESRSSATCHREGQAVVAKGTLTVHNEFFHRFPDAEVLGYRVHDRLTGKDVPLADASMAPDYPTPADLEMWRVGFERFDTPALRSWVESDAKGGTGTPYQEARSEAARAELATRGDTPAPVRRVDRRLVEKLGMVA